MHLCFVYNLFIILINASIPKEEIFHLNLLKVHRREAQQTPRIEFSEAPLLKGKKTQIYPQVIERAIVQIEEVLRMYVNQLKTYVKDRVFLKDKFDLTAGLLETQIDEITSWMYDMVPYNRKLAGHFRFAENFFQVMVNAVEYLKFYNASSQAYQLVREMINLKVVILALHDWRGLPDMTNEEYYQEMTLFKQKLESARKEFVSLEDVPFAISIMFDSQLKSANYTIQAFLRNLKKDGDGDIN